MIHQSHVTTNTGNKIFSILVVFRDLSEKIKSYMVMNHLKLYSSPKKSAGPWVYMVVYEYEDLREQNVLH
jgi:hypothetical protein